MLNRGIERLKEQRANFKPNGTVKIAPKYKASADAANNKYFIINHQPVTNIPAGQPITIKIKVIRTRRNKMGTSSIPGSEPVQRF
ncbi:MAG: hypothetical protein WDN26_19105 [Chitinophagaceae bacterium]